MMMRKIKHLVFLISLMGLLGLFYRASLAQDAGDASSTLCEYGIKLYKEGQIADAIHELKKALMVNPHNLKAKNYLMKIYAERGLLVGPPAPSAKKIKISEYKEQIKKLRGEARRYQNQLNALNKQNLAKEAELQRLNRQLDLQKELFSSREQDLLLVHKGRREKISALQDKLKRLEKETGDYKREFVALNDQYLAKQTELEKLTRQLRDYKGRREEISALQDKLKRLEKETGDYQKQLSAINGKYLGKEAEWERLKGELNSQKELLAKKEEELRYVQGEGKKQLADLASQRKELAKLKTDYESRLKKIEAKLKAKQDEESIMVQECQSAWTGELLDEFKEELPKLECKFDEEFFSTAELKIAERQGISSWEELNQELGVLMPSLESTFEEDEFFYPDDNILGFQESETTEINNIEEMLSESDK
jgi:DNA repair exonuclease SbcCD ATPase subunit